VLLSGRVACPLRACVASPGLRARCVPALHGRCVAVAWPLRARCVPALRGRCVAVGCPRCVPDACPLRACVAWPLRGRCVAVAWPLRGRCVPVAWPLRACVAWSCLSLLALRACVACPLGGLDQRCVRGLPCPPVGQVAGLLHQNSPLKNQEKNLANRETVKTQGFPALPAFWVWFRHRCVVLSGRIACLRCVPFWGV